jgi:nitroreductase
MPFENSIQSIVSRRKSVRTYTGEPVAGSVLRRIEDSLKQLPEPPLRSKTRFILTAAAEGDAGALNGLGTYGVIRRPAGFVIGAVREHPDALVDFGFHMQAVVLTLTDLGLGSCWLGGSFRKSRFSERIGAAPGECVPSVLSFGIPAEKTGRLDAFMRAAAGSDGRKPFESLFFESGFSRPLSREEAGRAAEILEMVRLAPSASNRQPWRVVLGPETGDFHFFLRRDAGYGRRLRWLKALDLQRVDMGIAACHFQLAAAGTGMSGSWTIRDRMPDASPPDGTVYVMTCRLSGA